MLLASKNAAIFTTKTIGVDVLLSKLFWTYKKVSHTNRGYGTQGFHETLLSFSYCQCISVGVTITLVSECKMYFIQTSLCTVFRRQSRVPLNRGSSPGFGNGVV